MKPGDRFWTYIQISGDKIYECVAEKVEEGTVWYQIVGAPRSRPYNSFLSDCFPTREALCEHYRKIFE